MKEIYQEYGTAIIAIITGIALIGLIFGVQYAGKTGIFEIAGTTLQKEETDYTAYCTPKISPISAMPVIIAIMAVPYS